MREGGSFALAEQQTPQRSQIVERAAARREMLIELRQLEIDDPQRIEPPAVGDGYVLDNRAPNVPDLLAEERNVFVSAFERAEGTFHG